jgi:hypothetical protein
MFNSTGGDVEVPEDGWKNSSTGMYRHKDLFSLIIFPQQARIITISCLVAAASCSFQYCLQTPPFQLKRELVSQYSLLRLRLRLRFQKLQRNLVGPTGNNLFLC